MNIGAEWAAVCVAAVAAIASFANVYVSGKISQKFAELRLEIAKDRNDMMEWTRRNFIEKSSFLDTVSIAVHKFGGVLHKTPEQGS
jgi:hypothetical protein